MRELPGFGNSDQWMRNKIGRISASRFADVMDYTCKGKESAKRRGYRMQLCAERLTGVMTNHYVSMEMQRGLDMEQHAIEIYQIATGSMVVQCGFVLHPVYDWAGASPDGLIDTDGLIECKAPKSETLLDWRITHELPEEYLLQMQWQMRCTGRLWCDFYGYDDRLPSTIGNLIERIERDEKLIAEMEAEAIKLNAEIEAMIAALGAPPTKWPSYEEICKQCKHGTAKTQYATSDEEMQAAADLIDSLEGGMVP